MNGSGFQEDSLGEFSQNVAQHRCPCGRITLNARCPNCGTMIIVPKLPSELEFEPKNLKEIKKDTPGNRVYPYK